MSSEEPVVHPGHVAVVTGAASGIGYRLAQRFAREGMSVVMADVEQPALEQAAASLKSDGGVLPVLTDVSKLEQLHHLRDRTLEAFGSVQVVCNNAGVSVGSPAPIWEMPQSDWDWVLGVNFWGILNGLRTFMPILVEQPAAHVVNTSSLVGVVTGHGGPYSVSKHASAALTESLYFQLAESYPNVGVSLLIPGGVRTNLANAGRNRPPSDDGEMAGQRGGDESASIGALMASGMDPIDVAGLVVDAIRTRRFYIMTRPNRNDAVRRRGHEILDGGPPRHWMS
ncbi:MAG: SDR family NAD(P)-dependent oxidoreductase [Acidimicrobiales bacterium]